MKKNQPTPSRKSPSKSSWVRLSVSPELRTMSPEEAAYVGAMLEADGTTYMRSDGCGRIIIDNRNPEIMSALLRATGVGRISGYQPTNGNFLMLKWAVARLPDVEKITDAVRCYSEKAQRLSAFIAPKLAGWRKRKLERTTCIDCGSPVSYREPHRCNSCAALRRSSR